MKRLLKLTTILIVLAAVLALLCACGEGDGAPEGMQLCAGTDELGFYFYVPEEWMLSPYADVYAAFAATVDTTSASYTETGVPAMSDDQSIPLSQRRAASAKSYFDSSMAEYKSGYTLLVDCEAVTFGNADIAFKFVFDHEHQGGKYRTMQILVYFEDRFGIFTFNSPNVPLTTDKPQFEYYSEKTQLIIDSFKFVSKVEGSDASTPQDSEPVYDSDGFLLITDKRIAGFELYIPNELTVRHSDGLVVVDLGDGASLSATKSNISGVTYDGYFNQRKSELEALFGTVTVIQNITEPWRCVKCEVENESSLDKCSECETARPIGVPYSISGATSAFLYEYTYTFMGEEYRVYQVLAATKTTGYSFTFTSRVADFDQEIDTVRTILGKVAF